MARRDGVALRQSYVRPAKRAAPARVLQAALSHGMRKYYG